MRVYRITDDDLEDQIVEALDFSSALYAWRVFVIEYVREHGEPDENPEDYNPRSVELIGEEGVIRYEPSQGGTTTGEASS